MSYLRNLQHAPWLKNMEVVHLQLTKVLLCSRITRINVYTSKQLELLVHLCLLHLIMVPRTSAMLMVYLILTLAVMLLWWKTVGKVA